MGTSTARRAIGIVRVSQVNGREGDSFASPGEQRDRIVSACERDKLRLLETFEELDVSGGKPLDQRPGLKAAVEAVEAGKADVIVAAYFDRLVRSLRVQDELVSRVEAAGGQVLAVDVGQVTNGSAGQWLSGTMLGAVSEYQRRTAAERSAEAQARAVARGVLPYPNIPPGLVRGGDGVLVPGADAEIVREAFRLRASGATVMDVRAHLAKHGIACSQSKVSRMLTDRTYLGEIHFGKLSNIAAHEALIDADTFQRVQRITVPRGRKAKSDMLLARLGVLRCGTCGSRMVVGSANNRGYLLYRCPPTGDCAQRVTISAAIVESILTDATRAALADVEGRASIEANAREAELELDRAREAFESAVRTLADFADEASVRDRLLELREARERAEERVAHLGGQSSTVAINAADHWDDLTLDERRALIRATVDRAVVTPGRGDDRVAVHLFSE